MTDTSNSYILAINCGSSSLKFSLYHSGSVKPAWSGAVSRIGDGEEGNLIIRDTGNHILEEQHAHYKNLDEAVNEVISWLKNNGHHYMLAAIGHRLVQGGPDHRKPELITNAMLHDLHGFIYLAPNHLPDELSAVKAFKTAFDHVPQVACFDTSFHQDMPEHVKYYPLPVKYRKKGLMHYGFHGLSYEYIMYRLSAMDDAVARQKIIIAHLGNGASMAAVKNGKGFDTTMGVSPIGGLVMGTRSGDLDPGVLLFLEKQARLDPDQVDALLSKKSGLKAIAGISDVQELLEREASDPGARLALTVFCYSAQKFIGAMAAAMGGLNRLVFTGGIGQNSAVIRERICTDLDFMGIELDKKLNDDKADVISNRSGRVIVNRLNTDEEWMIAKHTQDNIPKQ